MSKDLITHPTSDLHFTEITLSINAECLRLTDRVRSTLLEEMLILEAND